MPKSNTDSATTTDMPVLSPSQAMVRLHENGNYEVFIGANALDKITRGSAEEGKVPNRSFANTSGWGQQVVVIDPAGVQRPAMLRLNLTER